MTNAAQLELTATNVEQVVTECLFKDNEDADALPHVDAPGIMHTFRFQAERLHQHESQIKQLLAQLPREFFSKEDGGDGGWSFLNACMTSSGVQWGEHPHVEALLMLGTAIGCVKPLVDREMWPILPGGMPYYSVHSVTPVSV